MSSRQTKRLYIAAQSLESMVDVGIVPAVESSQNSDADDLSDDGLVANKFQIDDSSSDSTDSSTEEGPFQNARENNVQFDKPTPTAKSNKARRKVFETEVEFPVTERESNISATELARNSLSGRMDKIFTIDEKSLDVTALLRRRFGVPFNTARTMIRSRRYLFGPQKTNYATPKPILAGGYAMRICEPPPYVLASGKVENNVTWFEYYWSDEYGDSDVDYQRTKETGDAHQLVLFLSFHKCHLEALLQVSVVFGKTGEMDAAGDFTRQCLFCLEHCFLSSFHPQHGGKCRMDPTRSENSTLFSALFRHMRLSGLMGCPTVSASVGRYLLSLCPMGDPLLVLLMLDHFFVTAGQVNYLIEFTGCSNENVFEVWECPLELDVSPFEAKGAWQRMNATSLTTEKFEGNSATAPLLPPASSRCTQWYEASRLTLQHLPNWWYSLALGLQMMSNVKDLKKVSKKDHKAQDEATESFEEEKSNSSNLDSLTVLAGALLHWPFVFPALLKKCDVIPSKQQHEILSHELFRNSLERVPSGSPLRHIMELFLTRNATLFRPKEIQSWLWRGAQAVVGGGSFRIFTDEDVANAIARQPEFYIRLSRHSGMTKYLGAELEDFMETVPRLPDDVNALDPRFADPRAWNNDRNDRLHNWREDFNRRNGQPLRRQQQQRPLPDGGVDQELVRREMRRLQEMGLPANLNDVVDQLRRFGVLHAEGVERRQETNVDLDAPLLQLFWQTFLPWNVVIPHGNR